MNKKYFFLGLIIVALMLLSGCSYNKKSVNNNVDNKGLVNNENPQVNNDLQEQTLQEEQKSFTLDEVSKHNKKDDCWFVIHGKVYDVTSFISSHPGGESIVEGCGKDATQLFETRPMGSGTPHSSKARNKLETFFIGNLRNS